MGFQIFISAFLITLMLAVGGCAASLALNRMEHTMNTRSFTLFLLEDRGGGRYALTALNHSYVLGFTDGDQGCEPSPLAQMLVLAELNGLVLTAGHVLDGFSELLRGLPFF